MHRKHPIIPIFSPLRCDAGRGKISLYKKKECIEKNIPEEHAVEKLIELIKENGDFIER